MKNSALASRLESALDLSVSAPRLRAAPPPLVAAVPAPPNPKPPGLLQSLWTRIFGPPAIDPRSTTPDFAVFRALYEAGSDQLPSTGTWPAPSDFK